MFKYFLFIFIFLIQLNLKAEEIKGLASIIDGDTIKILNNKIRLYGIDAPEKRQKCLKKNIEYNCGITSTKALIEKIQKNLVLCKIDKMDRYKRFIGVCFIKKQNLNKWMVKNGHAVAYRRYSKDYIQDENFAKENKLGIWSGDFMFPEMWRKLN